MGVIRAFVMTLEAYPGIQWDMTNHAFLNVVLIICLRVICSQQSNLPSELRFIDSHPSVPRQCCNHACFNNLQMTFSLNHCTIYYTIGLFRQLLCACTYCRCLIPLVF